MKRARAAAALLAAALLGAACGGGTRDVIPETHDVHVEAKGAAGKYTYVARRPLGFVAVASQVGLDGELGTKAADRLADALDACATELAAKGKLVDGAIRIEAAVAKDGSVAVSHLTVAPGDGVAANALLCVVAPFKLTSFPPAESDARRFVIDATWGPKGAGG